MGTSTRTGRGEPSSTVPSRRRWIWIPLLGALALAAVLAAVLIGGESRESAPGGLSIPDDALRTAINTELGRAPDAEISTDDAASLTTLDASEEIVSTLNGLEHFTNLRTLDLDDNHPFFGSPPPLDLSPLADLKELRELRLNRSYVRDVTPLAGLSELRELELGGHLIDDVSPLSHLTGLRRLDLSFGSIVDVHALVGLDRLQDLNLQENEITSLSGIEALTNLANLDLSGNEITDITPLTTLENLQYLDLRGNSILDLTPLAGAPAVEHLSLTGQQLRLVDIPAAAPQENPVKNSEGIAVDLTSPDRGVSYDPEERTWTYEGDHSMVLVTWETEHTDDAGAAHRFDGSFEIHLTRGATDDE